MLRARRRFASTLLASIQDHDLQTLWQFSEKQKERSCFFQGFNPWRKTQKAWAYIKQVFRGPMHVIRMSIWFEWFLSRAARTKSAIHFSILVFSQTCMSYPASMVKIGSMFSESQSAGISGHSMFILTSQINIFWRIASICLMRDMRKKINWTKNATGQQVRAARSIQLHTYYQYLKFTEASGLI